jgi:dTMP kinase
VSVAPPTFIALEGLDGSGTTTLCRRLAARMAEAGRRVLTTREPSDGPIGSLVREILSGRWHPVDPSAVALLFAADRLDHLAREVQPALARGQDVLSDRYLLSSLAYQGREHDLDWVSVINERAVRPDLTLFLEVPPLVCLERLRRRGGPRELFEDPSTLDAVHRAYWSLLEAESQVVRLDRTSAPAGEGAGPKLETAHVVVLDGEQGEEAVAESAWRTVAARLGL